MKFLLTAVLAAVLVFTLTSCRKREYHVDIQPSETAAAPVETTQPPVTETTAAATEPVPETTEATLPPELADADFARVLDYIPTASQELFYATENNFTGHQIYEFVEVYLRYGTVKKLMLVAQELEQQGLYLKIWDGFRPVSAQFKLWEIYPNSTYVANPNKGYSNHSRGNAVDLTLVDAEGKELEMPTGFDDFSGKADRNYSDATPEAAANAKLLEDTMQKYGFQGYYGEWWHFNDTDSYPVEKEFEPMAG